MIKQAKKRGYITYEQLNAVMPSEEVTSEQIEDTLSMLSEMGINVIEQDEAADGEEGEKEEDDDDEGGELVEVTAKPLVDHPRRRSRPSAPTIPCACICAKWARSNCCRAKAKSRSPSASRPAARR